MAHKDRSPFERLKNLYDETDLKCPDCGYFDEGGEWTAETNGGTIRYSHKCPSCENTQIRTLKKK